MILRPFRHLLRLLPWTFGKTYGGGGGGGGGQKNGGYGENGGNGDRFCSQGLTCGFCSLYGLTWGAGRLLLLYGLTWGAGRLLLLNGLTRELLELPKGLT